jgi:hypothetical protein
MDLQRASASAASAIELTRFATLTTEGNAVTAHFGTPAIASGGGTDGTPSASAARNRDAVPAHSRVSAFSPCAVTTALCLAASPVGDVREFKGVSDERGCARRGQALTLLLIVSFLAVCKVANCFHQDPIYFPILAGDIKACALHLAADRLRLGVTQLLSEGKIVDQLLTSQN